LRDERAELRLEPRAILRQRIAERAALDVGCGLRGGETVAERRQRIEREEGRAKREEAGRDGVDALRDRIVRRTHGGARRTIATIRAPCLAKPNPRQIARRAAPSSPSSPTVCLSAR